MKLSKPVLISAVIVLIVAISAGIYWYSTSRSGDVIVDGISYAPPTEAELDEAQRFKESLVDGEDTQNQDTQVGNKKNVIPIISYWGQQSNNSDFEVNGYVPDIIEKNGTCKASLTRNGDSVSEDKPSLDDAQSTSCGLIVIPRSELSSGDWQLVLSYESEKSQGSSETVTVAVK